MTRSIGAVLNVLVLLALSVLLFVAWSDAAPTVPLPPLDREAGPGTSYCHALAMATQHLSWREGISAWILVCLGVMLMLIASFAGSVTSDDRSLLGTVKAHRGPVLAALGLILSAVGWQLDDRGDAATTASVMAHSALRKQGLGDALRMEACVAAKEEYLEGRKNSQRLERLSSEVGRPEPEIPSSSSGGSASR